MRKKLTVEISYMEYVGEEDAVNEDKIRNALVGCLDGMYDDGEIDDFEYVNVTETK